MRRIITILLVVLCLFSLFSIFASAATSVPLGNRSTSSSFFVWSSSRPSNIFSSWSDQLVILAEQYGFSVLGWDTFEAMMGRSGNVSYTWSSSEQFLLTFQYRVLDSSSLLASYGHSPSMPQGDVLGSYDYTMSFGTTDILLTITARSFTSESKETALYCYSPVFGEVTNFACPIFAPIVSSVEQDILDQLGAISGQLDDLQNGLFSEPSGWSDWEQSVSQVIDDEKSKEDYIDSVAGDLIGGVDESVVDVSGAISAVEGALPDNPSSSSVVKLLLWLWEVNPMFTIMFPIVILWFAIFLIVRTYP